MVIKRLLSYGLRKYIDRKSKHYGIKIKTIQIKKVEAIKTYTNLHLRIIVELIKLIKYVN